MSQQEIRWWLTEMRRRGWGTRVLGLTMGLRNPQCVMTKADGRQWIYPREQIRMSRQIKRILSGELVCIPGEGGVKGGTRRAGKAVIAEHPVPLVPPNKMVLDVEHLLRHGIGRFKLVPAYEPPEMRLPDFKTLRR
jgi:hypothetical protein